MVCFPPDTLSDVTITASVEKMSCLFSLLPEKTYRRYGRRADIGQKLPISISIGVDPAIEIGSCFEPPTTPLGYNELAIAGALRGEPVELAPCLTVKENCIANAEYVIEGEVIPGVRVQEDQNSHTGYAMPEFPGYTGPASSQCWLIKVKAVTHRKNPIMQTCIGPSEEHVSMAGIPTEASIYGMVEKAMPGRLQNVYCASPGGEKSHIGAVSGRVPGQEPVDIELPGHREGNLAAQWAEELYRTWEMPVWVECGIHYENLSKEGIRQVLDVCREMLEEILAERLENN